LTGPKNWRCTDCAGDDSEESDGAPDHGEEAHGSVNGTNEASVSPSSRRAAAPKLARDLLPSQKGPIKPDSHSVFNQLVLDEDPMDGSRVLRKRKTSSAEVEDGIMALRKRRRGTNDEQSEDEANSREGSARPHSARSLRIKTPNAAISVVKKTRASAIVKMRVPVTELREILSRQPRRDKRDRRDRKKKRSSRPSRNDASHSSVPIPPLATPFTSASYSQPFYSFYDKETDELKGKPYGGILTEAEADTSKTMPTNDDRRRFDEAKQKAEEEWRQRLLKMQAEIEVPAKKTKKASGPASQIECIDFGGWEIDTWYAAPYPEEYSRNRVLYICEFCLKYMNSDYVAWRHKLKCPAKHPPGDEIYRHNSVSVFEVDGRKNPVYCQNLCLLAKLFLGSKTLYYDVEPFLFYVLCEYDDLGYHFVGYFSKEKRASSQNNVSCILTLPIHQRKGYGNLLIDFSYLLTRVEQKTGSPEKPLSDMGLVSYRNYWRLVMSRYLLEHTPEDSGPPVGLSIKKMSEETGMTPDDVISALEGLRCLVRDPVTNVYAFRAETQYCREFVAGWEAKKYVQLDPSALTWTPYVMGRGNATNFELGPALTAIAPREEEDEPKPVVPVREALVNGTGPAEQASQDPKVDANTVLESTEPNDKSPNRDTDPPKPNGVLVNGEAQTNGTEKEANKDTATDWMTPYANIPPTRFEVVPPIAGSRRADRSRPVVPRPPVVRTASTAPRPRPKRPSGSARRSSASKPKSSSKRKTGGTGRGPGRWPKGTKKSDYGNADSGPGFPPGWFAERERSAALAAEKNGKTDAKDTVQVRTPTMKEAPSSAASRGNGSAGGKGSPGSQSQSGKENSVVDAVMEDAEDADGEDE
jgi:histone acetyltransferase SAS3